MNGGQKGKKGNGGREPVAITLPAEIVEKLMDFCRENNVLPDHVVERALIEYFREGDMSH